MHRVFWWGNLRARGYLENPGIDGRIILNWIFKKWDEGAWTGLMWLRKRAGGGLLWMWYWTFGFHKMQGIFWLSENRLACEEGLCSMESVTEITSQTLHNRVFLDKLIFAQLPRKFPIFFGSWQLNFVLMNLTLVAILSLMIPVHTMLFLSHPFVWCPPIYTLVFQDDLRCRFLKKNFVSIS